MWDLIFWAWLVAAVILCVLYKAGEEWLGLGKAGGVTFVILAALFIAVFHSIAGFSMNLVVELFFGGICAIIAGVILSEKRKKKLAKQKQYEQFEIRIIRNDLPMPASSQMASFIEDFRSTRQPSPQQWEYLQMLRKTDAGMETQPLDANHFKDMQAAWIYYSRTGILSPERKRIFGDQPLSEKQFFSPLADRTDEREVVSYADEFKKGVKNLSVQISDKWYEQPRFAQGIAKLVDESVPLSDEVLYPLMLESCDRSIDLSTFWMREDVAKVCGVLRPKMVHVLSLPMNWNQEKEWLGIEAFQIALLPMMQQGKLLKSEDVFPVLYKIYTEALLKDFTRQSEKHNFVLLWHGLNAVGKAVGKNASFLNYPKYIIE